MARYGTFRKSSNPSFFMALILVSGLATAPRAQQDNRSTPSSGADECVQFQTRERLNAGTSLTIPLIRGLELQLVAGRTSWDIRVGPEKDTLDYLWPVSPPLRTAPQRAIGDAYGLPVQQSVSLERHLRFVLSRAEYDEAVSVIDSGRDAGEILRRLDTLGRGRLTIVVSDYRIRRDPAAAGESARDVLEWMTVKGSACVPKMAK